MDRGQTLTFIGIIIVVQKTLHMEKKPRKKLTAFNKLTPKDWTKLSKSVWPAREVSSQREKHHLLHGATFPVALAERAIRMYSKKNDWILDPFLGVGSTLTAALQTNRKGIGFELYPKFAKISKEITKQTTFGSDGKLQKKSSIEVIRGDCRKLDESIKKAQIQLTFTSPPYANFIQRSVKDRATTHKTSRLVSHNKSVVKQYGDNPKDFGNLSYPEFLSETEKLMKKIYKITKPNGYNIWVVKDHRDPQHGFPYIPVHSDIAKVGENAGFRFHDLIVWDQNEQRSLVLLGYPTVFYSNINHTFLVVLRKTIK